MKHIDLKIECHPWEPFIPKDARILILGTFPPGAHRWSMPFFYPNVINDFWRIMGVIYYGHKDKFYLPHLKTFDLKNIKAFLIENKIALGDTGLEIRRLKGNASDKYLEILTPLPLSNILSKIPHCSAIATTGEKAAQVIADITNTIVPKSGEYCDTLFCNRQLRIYRMPSTSRAYPLPLEEKAKLYSKMLKEVGLINQEC